jgi:betaine-aldehyde dehydrogenase
MRIVQEEVFGPVLTVERFADEPTKPSTLANGTVYGLAGAVWTSDLTRAEHCRRAAARRHRVDQRLPPLLPPGTVGWDEDARASGGSSASPAYDEYTELKHIAHNTAPAPTGWFGTGTGPEG